jgi:hypothetical protein
MDPAVREGLGNPFAARREALTRAAYVLDEDLIESNPPVHVNVIGMRDSEGPYPEWSLPRVRWATKPIVELGFFNPAMRTFAQVVLEFEAQPYARQSAEMAVAVNGTDIRRLQIDTGMWHRQSITFCPQVGHNVVELRFGPEIPSIEPQLHMLFKCLILKAAVPG